MRWEKAEIAPREHTRKLLLEWVSNGSKDFHIFRILFQLFKLHRVLSISLSIQPRCFDWSRCQTTTSNVFLHSFILSCQPYFFFYTFYSFHRDRPLLPIRSRDEKPASIFFLIHFQHCLRISHKNLLHL